jgi:hypothetical protein
MAESGHKSSESGLAGPVADRSGRGLENDLADSPSLYCGAAISITQELRRIWQNVSKILNFLQNYYATHVPLP